MTPRHNSERMHWHGLLDFINELLTQPHIGEKNMGNKFVSWLEHIGRAILHIAESREVATAIQLFALQFGPAFNATVNAVAMAEQKYAALGKQTGTGPQKLADVLTIAQPVIAQMLADLGKPNDTAAVTNYINAVVTVLNAAPAPVTA